MNKAFEKILEMLDSKKHYFQKFYEADGKTEEDECINKATQLAFDDAKNIVQEVAEKYNGVWVPCSEKLPEENGKYLVKSKIYFVPDHVDEIDNYVGVKISHYSTRCGWLDDEVMAWQLLPEPFKKCD